MEELEPRLALSTVHWDGGGGDTSWHNPLNWSGDVLPGAGDDVVIDVASAPITHSQAVTTAVHSIFSVDPVVLSGGTISVASDWRQAAALTISGGTVAGAGNLVLNGLAAWSGGTLAGTGRVQVLAGRLLTIAGNVTLSRQIVNGGTLLWQSGNISADGGSVLNLAGHTMFVRSAGAFTQTGAASGLVNQGLILRDGDAGTTSTIGVAFNNFPGTVVQFPTPAIVVGTVGARSGTLAFTGSVAQRAGETLVGGRWVVENQGTLLLPGGDIASATGALSEVVLMGAGSSFPAIENASSFRILRLSGGRPFTFANATDAAVLEIANPGTTAVRPMVIGELDVGSGIVVASGAIGGRAIISAGSVLTLTGQSWLRNGEVLGAGLLNVVGTLEWVSGTIAGPGQMLIAHGGVLHVRADTEAQASDKRLTRRTVNYGTVEWDDRSGWGFQLGTELVNRGTLNLDSAGFLSTTSVGGVPVPAYITNFGMLNKGVAGDLTLRGADGGIRLANLGTVNVGAGRLFVFGGAGASGLWQAAAGAELVFGGLPQSLTGAVLGGFGRIRFGSNALLIGVTMAQNGDILITPSGTVAAFGSADWSRAVVTVQGDLYIGAGADVRVHGNLVNSGRVTIDASAVELKVIGNVTLLGSGVLATIIVSPSQLGKMVVEGDISLAGTLLGAFTAPADAGMRFDFVRAATFSGAFSAFLSTGLAAGRGIQWQWIHQGLFDERGQIVVV